MSLTYDYCLSTSVPESSAQKLLSSSSSSAAASTKNHYSKISTSRKIKNILKPVLRKIFKSKLLKSSTPTAKRNSYISATEKDFEFEWITEDNVNDNNNDDNMNNDNLANEELEKRLIEEIQDSSNDTAIFIFNENGKSHQLEKLNKKNFYIPVHFARTNAGTFFWTTAQKQPIEPYQIEWNFLDRWAQA